MATGQHPNIALDSPLSELKMHRSDDTAPRRTWHLALSTSVNAMPVASRHGPQAAADHYRIDLATVHGAMAFYCDNEAAINEPIRKARELGKPLGARTARSVLKEIKGHQNAT